MFGQHTSGGYKPFLSQYGLKGKVKTLKEFNGYHWATYHFNKEGLLTQTDNRTFTYDEQNRLKTISYNEGKSSFTYLPNNEVKEEVSGLGRETYYYVYDNKGNLLSKERKLRKDSRSSLDYKILYKYDKAGRLLEKKYDPSYLKKNKTIFAGQDYSRADMEVYEYDPQGNLSRQTIYDSFGSLKYIKLYKNGILTESQEYDWGHIYEKIVLTYDNNQVQEKVYNQEATPTLLITYKTTLDKQGNVILKTKEFEKIPNNTNKEKTIKVIEKREIEYYP